MKIVEECVDSGKEFDQEIGRVYAALDAEDAEPCLILTLKTGLCEAEVDVMSHFGWLMTTAAKLAAVTALHHLRCWVIGYAPGSARSLLKKDFSEVLYCNQPKC